MVQEWYVSSTPGNDRVSPDAGQRQRPAAPTQPHDREGKQPGHFAVLHPYDHSVFQFGDDIQKIIIYYYCYKNRLDVRWSCPSVGYCKCSEHTEDRPGYAPLGGLGCIKGILDLTIFSTEDGFIRTSLHHESRKTCTTARVVEKVDKLWGTVGQPKYHLAMLKAKDQTECSYEVT